MDETVPGLSLFAMEWSFMRNILHNMHMKILEIYKYVCNFYSIKYESFPKYMQKIPKKLKKIQFCLLRNYTLRCIIISSSEKPP